MMTLWVRSKAKVSNHKGGKHSMTAGSGHRKVWVTGEPSDHVYISKDGFRIKVVEKRCIVGGGAFCE